MFPLIGLCIVKIIALAANGACLYLAAVTVAGAIIGGATVAVTWCFVSK